MIAQKIEEIVKKLEYNWYKEKRKAFQQEPFYNSVTDQIKAEYKEYELIGSEEEGFSEHKTDINFTVDFLSYSWNNNLRQQTFDPLEADNAAETLIDARDIKNQIITFLMNETIMFRNVKAINGVIIDALDISRNTVNGLIKPNYKSFEYQEVLNNFLTKLDASIQTDFYHIKNEIQHLDAITDKLEFKLSQEEMVALLYILNHAGVFNTINYNDRKNVLSFCEKYFRFQSGGSFKTPKNYKTLSNKYGEFVNGENPKSLEAVKKRLQETIDHV